MKFNVMVINNGINAYDYKDDFKKFEKWVERKTPFDIEFYYTTSNLNLKHKSFGITSLSNSSGKESWGLDGVKSQLRALNIIPQNYYHVVIFVYELNNTDTSWIDDKNELGAWAYLHGVQGAQFIEIPVTKKWAEEDGLYRVLTHEIIHSWHQIAKKKGIVTNDTMDLYDREFEIEALIGNRARNIIDLEPHWKLIGSVPSLRLVIQTIKMLIKNLRLQIATRAIIKKDNPQLRKMAEAIKQFEGWFIGSISYRNNNPGNLRWSKFQIGQNSGFSVFEDYNSGWKALLFQLQIAADGRSKVYTPEDTINDFFAKYAPATDNNYPAKYAEFVAFKLGITVDTQLKELI